MFTIVIPTYNSEKHLGPCLNSILKQTFRDFEILIVDSLSDDKTVDLAREIDDDRINIISERDSGIYDAMNKGMQRASGKWLLFLGSDDQLRDEQVLLNTSKYLDGQNIVYGNVKVHGNNSWAKDGAIYDGIFDLGKLFTKNICHQSVFYNKEFIKKKMLSFSLKYPLCGDWDFNLKCRALTDFLYIDLIVADFNSGGLSTSSKADEAFSRDIVPNLISYFNLSPFDPLLDNPDFFRYYEVLKFQKRRNPIRYFARRILRIGEQNIQAN